MKKFLYCAAVVALATACTQEDDFLTAPSSQAQEQGLVLNATLANTDATTKGELYEDNKTYPFFWYAEQVLSELICWVQILVILVPAISL